VSDIAMTQRGPAGAARARAFVISIVGVIVVWELLGRFVINNDLVFAPLSHIFARMYTMALSGELWKHVKASGIAFVIGYSLAVIFGVGSGLLIALRPRVGFYVEPWLMALYATPMIALAPIFVVLLGIGLSSKIAIIFIEAFFPVTTNSALGIRSTSRDLIDASRSFGATEGQIVKTVLLPNSLPYIVAGMRIALGRGLAGEVVAEIFGSVAGVGNMIWFSAEAYDMPKLFSGVFILAGASIALMTALGRIERAVAPWRN
jgi:ABC-type nitrate/sulfonate/bicarbonate transport system permease component